MKAKNIVTVRLDEDSYNDLVEQANDDNITITEKCRKHIENGISGSSDKQESKEEPEPTLERIEEPEPIVEDVPEPIVEDIPKIKFEAEPEQKPPNFPATMKKVNGQWVPFATRYRT